MQRRLGGILMGVLATLALGCGSVRPNPARTLSAGTGATASAPHPIISKASVVAFWLAEADTIPAAALDTAREEFRHSNALVSRYLSDTDIGLIATVNDTVIVQLAGGKRRVVMLSGLDFPFGYVLIEPGYAEEFHTGITDDRELREAIDDYFGLESEKPSRKHRISQRPPEPRPNPLGM
jgi:hypothetical protein